MIKSTSKRNGKEITKQIEQAMCKKHGGKMKGKWSLSTSCLCNPFCQAKRKVEGSICSKCYAVAFASFRTNLAKKLKRNTELLTENVIPVEDMPIINRKDFRFEAFGDLNNLVQLINYMNLCTANPNTIFTLWTKNIHILERAVTMGFKKPGNLIIIQSSFMINVPVKKGHPWVDKTFTCWDRSYENADFINCGDKVCEECNLCYRKGTTDEINELVKKNS